MGQSVLKVCVTGAAGQISYSLLPMLVQKSPFEKDVKLDLVLLDLPSAQEALEGVKMELMDACFDSVSSITCSSCPTESFRDVDFAILIGSTPRKPGMERSQLLEANGLIFMEQGKAIEQVAKKTTKILVVGNPSNTNAYILSKCCPSIPPENITALTRLDHNRACSLVATKLSIQDPCTVKNAIIWGNHSSTQYCDFSKIKAPGIGKLLSDKVFIYDVGVKEIQNRGTKVLQARKHSSAMSAAKAICDHLRSWVHGTEGDNYVSMAVVSNGAYNVEKGLVFSFPCRCKDGRWKIVEDLEIPVEGKLLFDTTKREIMIEAKIANESLGFQ